MTKSLFIERNECPICKSNDITTLLQTKQGSNDFKEFLTYEKFYSEKFQETYKSGSFNDARFQIVKCVGCDFIYQKNILNNNGMFMLYNDWLDQRLLEEYYQSIEEDERDIVKLQLIMKYFKSDTLSVLDFGAGYGNFCKSAKKLSLNTFAFDLSNKKSAHLENEIGVHIINELSNYNDFFDFINVNQVFEHLANPLDVLNHLFLSLKRNGILYISVPNSINIMNHIKEGFSADLFQILSPHQHINAFTNNTLRLLAKTSCFQPMNPFKLVNSKLNIKEIKMLIKSFITYKNGTNFFLVKLNK